MVEAENFSSEKGRPLQEKHDDDDERGQQVPPKSAQNAPQMPQGSKEARKGGGMMFENVVGSDLSLFFLSDLTKSGGTGNVCIKINSISQNLRSRGGWQYRRLAVQDLSMRAELLISESKFSEWDFREGDCVVCGVKSNGIDNEGRLSLFFNDFLGPFDSAAIMFGLNSKLYEARTRSGERMKSSETVYQISAREAKSLLGLIKLWIEEGKPQHYTKWCQMHQIVATNLYYMGLVSRTASMSGFYYPTAEALDFFEGKRGFPKKKVFVKDKEGKHVLVSDEGEVRSFIDYLSDYADRDSALVEYQDALNSYRSKKQIDTS